MCRIFSTDFSTDFLLFSCPVPHTHTAIIANGDTSKAQFKLKIFSFVNDSVVYLHCKIHICVEILAGTCKMVSCLLHNYFLQGVNNIEKLSWKTK